MTMPLRFAVSERVATLRDSIGVLRATMHMDRARRAYAWRAAVLVFVGYYLGARLGLALTFYPNPVSVLWPPNAILFAAMLLVPARSWWVVIAAALPAHLVAELQSGVPVPMVLCWFISNVTEALIGATCVSLFARKPLTFATLRDVTVFLCAAFAATFLSSFLDSTLVALNRWGHSGYWDVWRLRMLSNVTASLTFIPLIVTARATDFAPWRMAGRARVAEAATLLTALMATTILVFDSPFSTSATAALVYLPLPFLLWAALRFGPLGASTAFAIVALLVIWGAREGVGPLATSEAAENAFAVQLFLMFVGPALLLLAAAMSERARAEQSLRASDRRFQLVLQATRDAVYERDLRSGEVWWSRNGLAQFGCAQDRCPGDYPSAVDLVHHEDRERLLRAHAIALQSGLQLWEAEFRLRRSDGSYGHVHEQGFVVRDAAGRAIQMVGALTDITERRDNDELSQRLAHASRLAAMGELTASIAHEINQPMSAILSNVDAAEMMLDAGDRGSAELRRILNDIRDDDLRASEVIRHIRGLSNKRETDFTWFDLNELVRAVVRLVAPTTKQRGVVVGAEYGTLPLVRGDRILVQQVLLNLLLNGMDAMAAMSEQQRRLLVTTARAERGTVIVSVRDRGHGIAAAQIGRIFDSFYTTKNNGMGMGLSIARSLVELHGGRIWAENNPDAGATLYFTLAVDAMAG
jgi:two-component system, LuxR family, sensor kinase FixL